MEKYNISEYELFELKKYIQQSNAILPKEKLTEEQLEYIYKQAKKHEINMSWKPGDLCNINEEVVSEDVKRTK